MSATDPLADIDAASHRDHPIHQKRLRALEVKLLWKNLERRFERPHDKIVACVRARGRAGEAIEIGCIPVANLEFEWRLPVEAKRQGDAPIRVVIATLA